MKRVSGALKSTMFPPSRFEIRNNQRYAALMQYHFNSQFELNGTPFIVKGIMTDGIAKIKVDT